MSSITYKPNSDIIHESQQLQLCRDLLDAGYTVLVEDHAMIPEYLKNELLGKYEKVKFIQLTNLVTDCFRVI
jgi:UDP-glucose 6-dehydrogenase